MKFLRIFCVWILLIAGLFAALFFKNDKFSTVGVVIAQDIQEEEPRIIFDDEMPKFVEIEVKEEEKTPVKTAKTDKNKSGGAGTISSVNINTAGMKELILLPGIGEATAQKIIDYRSENGKFAGIDDLKKVKGIGEKKFDAIKDFLKL